MYLPFLICIDVLLRDRGNYLDFAKLSLFSFYSMIPYLIFVLILSLIYEPVELEVPEDKGLNFFVNWIQEASLKTSLQTIPTLIRNLEYLFDVWIITLMTASYKAFSEKSYLFCSICGSVYLIMIMSFGFHY